MVVSHAWLLPGEDHFGAYAAIWAGYDEVLAAQSGFRGRWLLRGDQDRTHITHLRWWDGVEDYLALTERSDYQPHIATLSEHVDVSRYTDGYPRELAEVVLRTDPA